MFQAAQGSISHWQPEILQQIGQINRFKEFMKNSLFTICLISDCYFSMQSFWGFFSNTTSTLSELHCTNK